MFLFLVQKKCAIWLPTRESVCMMVCHMAKLKLLSFQGQSILLPKARPKLLVGHWSFDDVKVTYFFYRNGKVSNRLLIPQGINFTEKILFQQDPHLEELEILLTSPD